MSEASTVTLEEFQSFFYSKTLNCPVCHKDFESHIVRDSKLRSIGADTDFMPRYKSIDPNHYGVTFCTNCGYAALNSQFPSLTDRQQDTLKAALAGEQKKYSFKFPYSVEDVITRYVQALKCAEVIKAKASNKAFLSLRLAWVLRVAGGRADAEKECVQRAYDGLKEAYSDERFPIGNMDESSCKYLIADLARRSGQMSEALRWVADVVMAKGIAPALKDRAANLKDLIREGKTD